MGRGLGDDSTSRHQAAFRNMFMASWFCFRDGIVSFLHAFGFRQTRNSLLFWCLDGVGLEAGCFPFLLRIDAIALVLVLYNSSFERRTEPDSAHVMCPLWMILRVSCSVAPKYPRGLRGKLRPACSSPSNVLRPLANLRIPLGQPAPHDAHLRVPFPVLRGPALAARKGRLPALREADGVGRRGEARVLLAVLGGLFSWPLVGSWLLVSHFCCVFGDLVCAYGFCLYRLVLFVGVGNMLRSICSSRLI